MEQSRSRPLGGGNTQSTSMSSATPTINRRVFSMDIDVEMLIFLTTPPDYLHLKCPICLELLLDDPYLVSCCGQHFCGRCITKPSLLCCPLCGVDAKTRQ